MVRPKNSDTSPAAHKANIREGYGPNNPEPAQFKPAEADRRKGRLP